MFSQWSLERNSSYTDVDICVRPVWFRFLKLYRWDSWTPWQKMHSWLQWRLLQASEQSQKSRWEADLTPASLHKLEKEYGHRSSSRSGRTYHSLSTMREDSDLRPGKILCRIKVVLLQVPIFSPTGLQQTWKKVLTDPGSACRSFALQPTEVQHRRRGGSSTSWQFCSWRLQHFILTDMSTLNTGILGD